MMIIKNIQEIKLISLFFIMFFIGIFSVQLYIFNETSYNLKDYSIEMVSGIADSISGKIIEVLNTSDMITNIVTNHINENKRFDAGSLNEFDNNIPFIDFYGFSSKTGEIIYDKNFKPTTQSNIILSPNASNNIEYFYDEDHIYVTKNNLYGTFTLGIDLKYIKSLFNISNKYNDFICVFILNKDGYRILNKVAVNWVVAKKIQYPEFIGEPHKFVRVYSNLNKETSTYIINKVGDKPFYVGIRISDKNLNAIPQITFYILNFIILLCVLTTVCLIHQIRIKMHETRQMFDHENELNDKLNQVNTELLYSIDSVSDLNDKLKETNEQLQESIEYRDKFLSTMSHELRTPLNAIIGFSDIMINELFGNLIPKYKEYAIHINKSGYSLLEFINDILNYRKIMADGVIIEKELIDINIIKNIVNNIYHEKNLSFDLNSSNIIADIRTFNQIITNVFSNCIKYGGNNISFKSYDVENKVVLEIHDDGNGIPNEKMNKLFVPFYTASTHIAGGTGLGLPLIKKLIEMNEGEIDITNINGTLIKLFFMKA